MDEEKRKDITLNLLDTFEKAGQIALELRKKGLKKEIKKDKTPVTNGDIEVNKILTKKILNLTPNIPIISEESSDNKNNKNLKNFWLIDPIDGTYDYINNREEFTLNAALIVNKKPVIGIINAPDKKRIFYSYGYSNSYEKFNQNVIKLINVNRINTNKVIAVAYSNELKKEVLKIHKEFNVNNFKKMKSSYKFCVIAAGEYDLYVAEPRACEWDIAAGHAILEHAGGKVSDFYGNEILYGKKNFKNSSLILRGRSI